MRPLQLLLGSFLLTSPLLHAADPPRGAALLKTDILSVLAHPDDETGLASTLAYYAGVENKTLTNVYCTRGEGGGNMVGTHWGTALGILREAELRHCLDTLGVTRWFFLDQLDWAYTESAAMTLAKWDRQRALENLVRYIRATRPEIILTMNPVPRAGQHGHHQAAGILAVEAFDAADDPDRFPGQIETEGLTAWQPRKLFFRTHTPPGQTPAPLVSSVLPVGKNHSGRDIGDIVNDALRNHRSQGFDRFSRSRRLPRPDHFLLVKSVLAPDPASRDLFAGLPVTGAPKPIQLHTPRPPAPLSLTFTPRPAYQNFQRWAQSNGVSQLTENLTSDIPVVTGELNRITLTLTSNAQTGTTATLDIALPDAWHVPSRQQNVTLQPGENTLALHVTPPAGTATDTTISTTLTSATHSTSASTTLHPLPRINVQRIATAPTDTEWENATPIAIPSENIVQGSVDNSADNSATFRLLDDGENLHVAVTVADQTVVSNIAPDDIRGHWRTDSVEICIDPDAGSEHTLGCFKVGIFPFDSTGVPRAARDAGQGPIETTAPGMTLASHRTPDGYHVRTAIPWSLIGKTKNRLGFNIIIYDGDKPDASPGENINQSRLAWAPQRGVQGRPEDWGRIDVD